jgi:hypothetical protein
MNMADSTFRLKHSTGWFAAGEGFRKAMRLLPDSCFKLFAHLSLEADRRTGCIQTTIDGLARELNKSKQELANSIEQLRLKGFCNIQMTNTPCSMMLVSICDDYWPYERESNGATTAADYIAAVRECFLALECTAGKFGAGDIRKARQFEKLAISLETVQDALLTGACRKLLSWLDGRISAPIGSLAYFEDIVLEMDAHPLPPGYREYLALQVKKLALTWKQQTEPPSTDNQSF